jgi:hypothetical protein
MPHYTPGGPLDEDRISRIRVVWALFLCIAYPFTIIYPFYDTYLAGHVAAEIAIPFDFSNTARAAYQ